MGHNTATCGDNNCCNKIRNGDFSDTECNMVVNTDKGEWKLDFQEAGCPVGQELCPVDIKVDLYFHFNETKAEVEIKTPTRTFVGGEVKEILNRLNFHDGNHCLANANPGTSCGIVLDATAAGNHDKVPEIHYCTAGEICCPGQLGAILGSCQDSANPCGNSLGPLDYSSDDLQYCPIEVAPGDVTDLGVQNGLESGQEQVDETAIQVPP